MHSNFWWDQCVWPQKGCRCQSINVVKIQRCRYVYVHIHMYDTACAYMHVHLYIYIYICIYVQFLKKYLHILEKQNAQQMWKTMHWRIDIESTQTCGGKKKTQQNSKSHGCSLKKTCGFKQTEFSLSKTLHHGALCNNAVLLCSTTNRFL